MHVCELLNMRCSAILCTLMVCWTLHGVYIIKTYAVWNVARAAPSCRSARMLFQCCSTHTHTIHIHLARLKFRERVSISMCDIFLSQVQNQNKFTLWYICTAANIRWNTFRAVAPRGHMRFSVCVCVFVWLVCTIQWRAALITEARVRGTSVLRHYCHNTNKFAPSCARAVTEYSTGNIHQCVVWYMVLKNVARRAANMGEHSATAKKREWRAPH